MYLLSNRFVICTITSGALANFLSSIPENRSLLKIMKTISIGEALANFAPRTQLFTSITQTIFHYYSLAYFPLQKYIIYNSHSNKVNQISKDNHNNNNIDDNNINDNILCNNKTLFTTKFSVAPDINVAIDHISGFPHNSVLNSKTIIVLTSIPTRNHKESFFLTIINYS